MANTLKNLLHTQLSTDSATLYTCPSNTKTIVIGMSAANVLSNNNANFSAGIQDSSGAAARVTHIVKNATVAPGGTEVIVGGDHKIILEPTHRLKAVASDSDSLDIVVSFVEQT